MKKINILSQSVYNRIAAGEVVDRPYSAVKELIENSLDAGAKNIEIYVERGGKELIKVVDDGEGIQKDDLPAAFMPHATSKIKEVDDLDTIKTLGFRGEALASISAISNVEIISVTEGNPAYKITCEAGKTGQILPAALEKGTQITVKKLFYNTPVRAKFLKPDKKEESDITSFVSRYILCKPKVSFKYFADGNLTLQSFGGGLEEAVAQVYGAKTLSQCLKIDAVKDDIHVYGFIGNQNFFKSNKSCQSVFLNGRYIVNNTVATAISNAYSSYAMKRQFPFYVLNVDVPADMVDVNVHPNKSDVRFIDNRLVFGVVYKIVSSVLDGTATAAEFVVTERIPQIKSASQNLRQNEIYSTEPAEVSDELIEKYKPEKFERSPEDTTQIIPESEKPESGERDYYIPERDMALDEYFSAQDYKTTDDDNSGSELSDNSLYLDWTSQQKIPFESVKFLGALFNTYLLVEYEDSLYIIDQHAAHERLIFDRLRVKVGQKRVERQPLLIPYVFEVNYDEKIFLDRNRKNLLEMGFDIVEFGLSTYKVAEIPAEFTSMDVESFVKDLLTESEGYKNIILADILKDKLATVACKHAVRGGKNLTEQEVKQLLKLMDGNVGLKCPHGRPVCVVLSKRAVEKMFKRVK